MTRAIKPDITPARLRVLEFLEKNPGYFVKGSGLGTARKFASIKGWIDYARNDRNEIIGEQLTEQGRAALSAHRLGIIKKPEQTHGT